ncbi:class I SAM-dependent methyltransferase [Paenibacillus paeoniae]|uniref:Class I SAM-dependent methyltransferase n=1 Tax=Paenibacillus paeoniae TaxID=2292705 RepID=A0A371PGJ8_9BACL|nr:class I SAM-dependent methyltransferase [Paenibacillus paeoniae]REK75062.1 class I SAM-dependent methyltransferase [Paenibacillus paeoniae]
MIHPVSFIIECMGASGEGAEIQRIQTEHRLKLAGIWGIREGERVLEIGCGQGDTTAVLAYLTGESGFIHGIDIAPPDYGAPVTLGEAALRLKSSPLGSRIQIDFEKDVLHSGVEFPPDSFDVIVLSHCSWYFQSAAQLGSLLAKVRPWARRLCFAEWDARISSQQQYAHFLAVLIQAQYEVYKTSSSSNVRTLFTPPQINAIAEKAGWSVSEEQSILSSELQDGKWEAEYTLAEHRHELEAISHLPEKLRDLIEAQVYLLEETVERHGVGPMATYVMAAL